MTSQTSTPASGILTDTSADVRPVVSKLSVFFAVVARSAPRLIEASLIPSALFYCCLVFVGIGAAYAAAVLWLYAAVASRLVRHRPVPPLLVLGAIGITVRTTVAIASGSTFFYFAQPVLGSLVVGCVFLVSIAVGRPMVQALALEFWPLTPDMLAHPAVGRLLRQADLPVGWHQPCDRRIDLHVVGAAPTAAVRRGQAGRRVVDHRRRHRHHDRPVGADRSSRWLRRRSAAPLPSRSIRRRSRTAARVGLGSGLVREHVESRRGKRTRDDVGGDLGELPVVVTGVVPQRGEGLLHVEAPDVRRPFPWLARSRCGCSGRRSSCSFRACASVAARCWRMAIVATSAKA